MRVFDAASQSDHSDGEFSQIMFEMTTLFFEGIDPGHVDIDQIDTDGMMTAGANDNMALESRQGACTPRLFQQTPERETCELGRSVVLKVFHRNTQFSSVRWFVRRLSQAFNNLLMGILANATLIAIDRKDNKFVVSQVRRLELLITTAANLTHLLFGYLSERRIPAKKLQLEQLLSAVAATIQSDENQKRFDGIKASMIAISPIHDRFAVAFSMSTVIEKILDSIRSQWSGMKRLRSSNINGGHRLRLVDDLIASGYGMAEQLRFYSGHQAIRKKRLSLRRLIEKQMHARATRDRQIQMTCRVSKSLPWIYGDRQQLGFALNALIDNAVESMKNRGTLQISAKRLNDERPSNRCGVHHSGEYVVITIEDSGCGMDRHTQAKIFEPFYRNRRKRAEPSGLGLSAACGIVKSHGGYIQVRSIQGEGSTFQIYLPTGQTCFHLLKQEFEENLDCAA